MLIPILLSCKPAAEAPLPPAPLPVVWGTVALEDQDTDPDVVEVHLTASETEILWSDDADDITEEVWAYNGVVPGPVIQAWLGQTVRVVFTNDLPDETTIHWHGLRIDDEMDGVPAIQDPIQPGETFTYEFTPPDSGTFWYHPHVRSHEQIERGLQGALIVHEPDAPVVQERMFVLDDVSIQSGGSFESFTIGHMTSVHGRFGNTLLANGVNALVEPLSDTLSADTGERWRIVNTANARTLYADVTNASWRVIAVDGTLLPDPYEPEWVQLPIGRRFDLEVIPDGSGEPVVLRILLPDTTGGFDEYPVFEGTVSGEIGSTDWQDWPATALPEAPDSFEQDVSLVFDNEADGNLAVWTINGDTWDEHEAIEVTGGTDSEIEITDESGAEHPFHLHGQLFQVLTRDGEPVDEPGLMDTVMVNPDETLTIWTDFSNPGRWMTHCHILEHTEQGMM
ncbi:MAG: FtsP/CotA-like multicopper oxidase with cupredoxin domain, partial [Myxococcota bacterium]